MSYTIEEHKHRFSAWATGRTASVNRRRFKVKQAKAILESAYMNQLLGDPNNLPTPREIDNAHRIWRNHIIDAAKVQRLTFTHGIAAKLINIYLKAGFVCGGHHEHERVKALHQSIDLAGLGAHGIRRAVLVGQISIPNNTKPSSKIFATYCRIKVCGKSNNIGAVFNNHAANKLAARGKSCSALIISRA